MKRISSLVMAMMMFAVFNVTHAQIRKIPAEVTEAFKEKYPNTKNVEWKDN